MRSLLSPSARVRGRTWTSRARLTALETFGWARHIRTRHLERYDAELTAIIRETQAPEYEPRDAETAREGNWREFDLHPISLRQRDRLERVADLCASRYPGDFVEIGSYRGLTTVRLAEAARRHGRRVIAVDPWLPGEVQADGAEFEMSYDAFLETVRDHLDVIDVVRGSSLDPDVQALLRARPLSFSYVDGLHTYAAALSDVLTVAHTRGFIAVDDTHWVSDYQFKGALRLAASRAAKRLGRVAVQEPTCWECYLLPS